MWIIYNKFNCNLRKFLTTIHDTLCMHTCMHPYIMHIHIIPYCKLHNLFNPLHTAVYSLIFCTVSMDPFKYILTVNFYVRMVLIVFHARIIFHSKSCFLTIISIYRFDWFKLWTKFESVNSPRESTLIFLRYKYFTSPEQLKIQAKFISYIGLKTKF